MPFLHSVRNCKVHRGVTCTREKYFLSGRGGQISKPKTKIQALLLLAMILLSWWDIGKYLFLYFYHGTVHCIHIINIKYPEGFFFIIFLCPSAHVHLLVTLSTLCINSVSSCVFDQVFIYTLVQLTTVWGIGPCAINTREAPGWFCAVCLCGVSDHGEDRRFCAK